MALTAEDCRTMIEECRGNGVRLGVGFHLRHHPGLAEARQLIAGGAVGRPVEVVGQWCNGQRGIERVAKRTGLMAWWSEPEQVGGGAIMATGTHVLDQVRFLTGQEVAEVTAIADYRGEDLDQAIHIVMKLRDGAIASVMAARLIAAADSRNDIVVYGSQGRVAANGMLATALTGSLDVSTEGQTYTRDYAEGNVYRNLIEAFCDSVERGEDPGPVGSGWVEGGGADAGGAEVGGRGQDGARGADGSLARGLEQKRRPGCATGPSSVRSFDQMLAAGAATAIAAAGASAAAPASAAG